MLDTFMNVLTGLLSVLKYLIIPIIALCGLFIILCLVWVLIFRFRDGRTMPKSNHVRQKRPGLFKQLFVYVPRRYVLDQLEKDPDFFDPCGLHLFCGEQGCGKTAAATEMVLRLQSEYPNAKVITNYSVTTQDDELLDWHTLLDYSNGKKGVICALDEIQNWFMSGKNQTLPDGVLELVTQNRKNRRIIIATSQIFTRVNKGVREQCTMVYNPHTFLRCFTVVIMRKPILDSEGNVLEMKYRGLYAFTHSDELRNSYDTYKVIHTLSKDGIREVAPVPVNRTYVVNAKAK